MINANKCARAHTMLVPPAIKLTDTHDHNYYAHHTHSKAQGL